MKTQSTDTTKNTVDIYMEKLKETRLESTILFCKKFNSDEMKTCLEATMSISVEGTLETFEEILFKTLKTDFGVFGDIMSGSNEHYSLIEKINLLTESEKDLIVLLCYQFYCDKKNIFHSITELVNEHCQPVVLWPRDKIVELKSISGSLGVSLDFKSFVSSVCNDVNCMDIYTGFSIPSSDHNSMTSVEILGQMIGRLGYQVLSISPVEEFNYDDNTVTQVNYVIDTNLPIHIYFSLMADEAA